MAELNHTIEIEVGDYSEDCHNMSSLMEKTKCTENR